MTPIIVWFRQDLRLADNPALSEAATTSRPIIPLYILEQDKQQSWSMGAASKVWLDRSLRSLRRSCEELGGSLILRQGCSETVLTDLIRETQATSVYWNRCYEPAVIDRDTELKTKLRSRGIEVRSFNAALLYDPWVLKTKSGTPFKVFTPFWKTLVSYGQPQSPCFRPDNTEFAKEVDSDTLENWSLIPKTPDWSKPIRDAWTPGEKGAQAQLQRFLDEGLNGYAERRDRPDLPHCSALSPYLHFGEISPRQIWQATMFKMAVAKDEALIRDCWAFLREVAWREFSYHLLFHYPELPTEPWNKKFNGFQWNDDQSQLLAWQRGQTGYPFIDAGMRQLWHTGWIHNRVRMVAASFLTKHLLLHWRKGEQWFWDTLVDADLANNAASWQWVAGCGFDAAPYFRIFNPMTQGKRFDPNGEYVRRWVPELSKLPNKYIHAPWEAPAHVLAGAGVALGSTYPHPIVDHKAARVRALDSYAEIRT